MNSRPNGTGASAWGPASALCAVATIVTAGGVAAVGSAGAAWAGNPIVEGRGLTDPHATVLDGRVYLYATHDFSPDNKTFVMKDWWVWSSSDLVEWKHECTLKPEETFIGKPFASCWATFGVGRGGKYYWYFSAGPEEIGVVVADSPAGPWKDPLGKPLVPKGLTPTEQRDPDILLDDDGAAYIVYGTFDYFIARLGDDMISLAESPRPVQLDRKFGPYGEGRTDDKPSLHKRNGIYYLSWSSFYAMADNVYGPYTYKGSVIDPANVAPEFRTATLFHDRHGNFFTFHDQTYFVCNDRSRPGRSEYFRDSILTYVHYRDNGEIAPVRIDSLGVGRHNAAQPRIEAEEYFSAAGAEKRERPDGGFEMRITRPGGRLVYPKVANLPPHTLISLRAATARPNGVSIEIRESHPEGRLLGVCAIPDTGGGDRYRTFTRALEWGTETGKDIETATKDICLVFKGGQDTFDEDKGGKDKGIESKGGQDDGAQGELCRLDWFAFSEEGGP